MYMKTITNTNKICKNPHCFEDTCKGECINISEIVLSPEGKKVRLDKLEEPDSHLDNGLSEDGEFTQYFEHTPLRSKYLYDVTPSSSKS